MGCVLRATVCVCHGGADLVASSGRRIQIAQSCSLEVVVKQLFDAEVVEVNVGGWRVVEPPGDEVAS